MEELLLLIGELKSPEFGKKVEGKCEENDEEVDEDEILNKSDNVDDKGFLVFPVLRLIKDDCMCFRCEKFQKGSERGETSSRSASF